MLYIRISKSNKIWPTDSRPSNGLGVMTSSAVPFSGQSAAMAGITRDRRTSEEDRRNERVVQGMQLLLAAWERILTMAEQHL